MTRLLCLLLLLPVMCAAQATSGFHRVNQVIARSNSGTYAQVVPGATVFVQNTATGIAATIYSDPLLTLTIPGAIVTTDFSGNYGYYLPLNTCVTENISSPSQGSLTIPNICGNSGLSLPLSTLNGGTGTNQAPLATQILVGQAGSAYLPETMIGDCTLAANATITCLKTNGVPFTTAATTAIGTSGSTLPLLSTANTWAQNQTFSGSSTTSTILGVSNATSKNWQLVVNGSAAGLPGYLNVIDATDGTTVLSLSNISATLFGSPICTTGNGACAVGSGTVTSFAAPSGGWPTWLVPTVATSTTTPSLTVAASAIPNAALANTIITVNSIPCTLGSTCTIPASSSARTCNANGCYITFSDGTLLEWGSVAGCSGAGCTVAVTFPFPFSTTADLSPTATCQGQANCAAIADNLTSAGFNFQYTSFVIVGGSGGTLSGQTGSWIAMGH